MNEKKNNSNSNNSNSNNSRKVGVTEDGQFMAMENLQEIQRLPSINPVNLDYFGAEQCRSGDSFGPYVRVSYVIHIVRFRRTVQEQIDLAYPLSAPLRKSRTASA